MMTTQTDNSSQPIPPIPEGYNTVTPWIIVRGAAELIDYLKRAFDAIELGLVNNADGKIGHAEVRIGDSVVMLFDSRDSWPETPAFFRLYVADGDAVYRQAIAAGGTSLTEMTDMGFGDRVGRVRDPFGNVWWIQQRIEVLTPDEMGKRAADPQYVDAMRQVEGSLDRELSSRKQP